MAIQKDKERARKTRAFIFTFFLRLFTLFIVAIIIIICDIMILCFLILKILPDAMMPAFALFFSFAYLLLLWCRRCHAVVFSPLFFIFMMMILYVAVFLLFASWCFCFCYRWKMPPCVLARCCRYDDIPLRYYDMKDSRCHYAIIKMMPFHIWYYAIT